MTDTATKDKEPAVYGGMRRARGHELAGITPTKWMIIIGLLLGFMFILNFSLLYAAMWLLASIVGAALFIVPFGARRMTVFEMVSYHIRGRMIVNSTSSSLVSGPLTKFERRNRLPGIAAPVVLANAPDGRGDEQAVLVNTETGRVAVMLRCAPVGITLADGSSAQNWVNNYGGTLSDLGYKPSIESVAITIDSAPTGGRTQRDYVEDRMAPHRESAPEFAQQVLDDLVRDAPAVSADVTTTVTATFSPEKMQPTPRTMEDAVAEAVRWLPSLENNLSAAGATVIGRAKEQFMIRRIRMAYDPASRAEASRELELGGKDAEILAWSDAGPMRAEEYWDYYQHDSGYSVSWALDEPPRGQFMHSVLIPMLAPGRYMRRVSMVYEPFPASQATKEVEKEVSAGTLRNFISSRTKKDVTMRDIEDRQRALKAAMEEALGAGVGTWTMYVTTTVTDLSMLPAAIADVEERAGQSKLRLRRARGAEAAGFSLSLGLPINPNEIQLREGERWKPE